MTEPTELLPCPFCGATSEVENDFGTTWWVQCHGGQHTDGMLYGSHAEAVAAWNTRQPQPTQAQAGAVPLTDEQWQRIADLTDSILTRATKDEIERVIGIKGGQHGAE